MCKIYGYITIIFVLISDVFCFGLGQARHLSIKNADESKLLSQTKSCSIPSAPNTFYFSQTSGSEKTFLSPDSPVNGNAVVVHLECRGIARESTSWHGEHYMICYDGQWYPPNNVCIRLCPPLSFPNSRIECTLMDEPVSCEKNIRPRTVAIRTCKSGYIDLSNPLPNICLDTGEWKEKYVDCFTDCGEIDKEYQSDDSEYNDLVASPWVAGIYRKMDGSEDYKYICGATLIKEDCIITAARCVKENNGSLIRSDLLRVGLGKSYMMWNDIRDIHAQKFEVTRVTDRLLHALLAGDQLVYLRKSIEFLEPVSFLFMRGRIAFTSFVRPICSDTQAMNSQIEHLNGTITGWDPDDGKRLSFVSSFYKNKDCKTLISNLEKRDDELEKEIMKFGRFCTDRVLPGTFHGSSVIYRNETIDIYYLVGVLIGIYDSVSIFQGLRDNEAAHAMLAYYNNLMSRLAQKQL